MHFATLFVMTSLLGLAIGKSMDSELLRGLIERLEDDRRETEQADLAMDETRGLEKRLLYGAIWDEDSQMITLYPQRTKGCMSKNQCIFELTMMDGNGKVIAAFRPWRWNNTQKHEVLRIPLDEILESPLGKGNEQDKGKTDKGDKASKLQKVGQEDNAIKPDLKEIVCQMCRLVDMDEDLWTCNKRTLDLTKAKDVNFWWN